MAVSEFYPFESSINISTNTLLSWAVSWYDMPVAKIYVRCGHKIFMEWCHATGYQWCYMIKKNVKEKKKGPFIVYSFWNPSLEVHVVTFQNYV